MFGPVPQIFPEPLQDAISVVSKCFKLDIHAIHVKDLNFVLSSEIFVHYDEQLRASQLILNCVPSYTSYQDPRPALIVGSPLLSYINVRLPRFLSRGLTVGEARERGSRYVREGFLVPTREGLADLVFQGRAEHIPVEDSTCAKDDDEMVQ
nr:hypothetical protein CFP56_71782 [Quercus suber]